MTFRESISVCFKKYLDFDGRARRSEYLYFAIFTGLVSYVLAIVFGNEYSNGLLSDIWSLATLLPMTAVSIRRLHDTGHKWTWYLGILVPLFNLYVFYLILFKAGDAGENRFGPDPKAFGDGIVSISVPEKEPVSAETVQESAATAAEAFEETVAAAEPVHVPEAAVAAAAVSAAAVEAAAEAVAEAEAVKTDEPDIIQQVVHAEYHPTEEIKLDLDEPVAPEFPNPLDDSPVCPGCGARVGKGDKFCGLCGTKIR